MAATRFTEPIEPMTLGNMRANSVRSLDADVWATNGVHALRDHRRRCPAELAGEGLMTADQAPGGSTCSPAHRTASPRPFMRAHGFTVELLAGLVRDGFAVAAQEGVKAGVKMLSVVRVTITDAGRRDLCAARAPLLAVSGHRPWPPG
jgi:hypothetical protein